MKHIALLVPEAWIPMMDEAKKDQYRNAWIRDVIRDALKNQGIWPEEDEYSNLKRHR